jgi:hypothetical protein
VAMFGAGYSEAEVWAAMTDPVNGISDRFFQKGRYGEGYLALTIGKVSAVTGSVCTRRRDVVRLEPPRVGEGTSGKAVVRLG